MCRRLRLPFFPWSIAGVLSSQALPGFLITAPSSVLVPAVLGALAVWIQNQKKKSGQHGSLRKKEQSDTLRSVMPPVHHLVWARGHGQLMPLARCYRRGHTRVLAGSPVGSIATLQVLLYFFASWYGWCVSVALKPHALISIGQVLIVPSIDDSFFWLFLIPLEVQV